MIDSHTEGEPTRVVIAGWPELRGEDMAARSRELAGEWDHLRQAVVCEPRGHDALVGALLTPPVRADAHAGVIFFNNVGLLGMCGHGLIGVVRTLAHIGRAGPGEVRIDTPVGPVSAWLGAGDSITIRNVPARAHALDVEVDTPSFGTVTGDIAYGGNWFFIASSPGIPLEPGKVRDLTSATQELLDTLHERNVTGADGAVIDHIELTAMAGERAGSVNFVLCPGGAWDRSPCGTGTSAKLAVLHARGLLKPGDRWRQRSVTGGEFIAWLEESDGVLHPHVQGNAWITGEAALRFDPGDPLRAGFTAR
ncbi:MAG TPA: proline racemase family protein [Longimicrobiales bacterium]